MARLPPRGGVAAPSRRAAAGKHLKLALISLTVMGAVLGALSMAPASLHADLHTSNSRKELREETEGIRPASQVQQAGGEAMREGSASDAAAAGTNADASSGSGGGSTRIIEHSFDVPDGTAADTSLHEVEEQRKQQQQEEEEQQREQQRQEEEQQKQQAAAAAAADGGVANSSGDKYHVVCSLGGGTYVQWQSRMAFYWYKKVKAACEAAGPCAMGGYTRLLHSGAPDEYMDEIPTVVVDPLPEELQSIAAGYVVLDRPYAFKQWAEKYLDTIEENYIWMGEPDHIFLRPPPLWATPKNPAAFPFFYIEPEKNKALIDRFNPKKVHISQFDTIGNSPVQIHKHQFAAIVGKWYELSIAIKNDTEADRVFGWVQEMYAYSIAAATALDEPVRHQLHVEMQLQPPWDTKLTSENSKPAYMIHFTYGNDFDGMGEFTPGKVGLWHWDKRDWMGSYPPVNFPLPPKGCTNEAVKRLIRSVNEAAANLPGWDRLAGQLPAPAAQGQGQEKAEGGGEELVGDVTEQRRRRRRMQQLAASRPGSRPHPSHTAAAALPAAATASEAALSSL